MRPKPSVSGTPQSVSWVLTADSGIANTVPGEPAKEDNLPSTQLNQVSAMNSGVDGKVWAQNSGFAGVHRFDLATGKVTMV